MDGAGHAGRRAGASRITPFRPAVCSGRGRPTSSAGRSPGGSDILRAAGPRAGPPSLLALSIHRPARGLLGFPATTWPPTTPLRSGRRRAWVRSSRRRAQILTTPRSGALRGDRPSARPDLALLLARAADAHVSGRRAPLGSLRPRASAAAAVVLLAGRVRGGADTARDRSRPGRDRRGRWSRSARDRSSWAGRARIGWRPGGFRPLLGALRDRGRRVAARHVRSFWCRSRSGFGSVGALLRPRSPSRARSLPAGTAAEAAALFLSRWWGRPRSRFSARRWCWFLCRSAGRIPAACPRRTPRSVLSRLRGCGESSTP